MGCVCVSERGKEGDSLLLVRLDDDDDDDGLQMC